MAKLPHKQSPDMSYNFLGSYQVSSTVANQISLTSFISKKTSPIPRIFSIELFKSLKLSIFL